eukprot:3844339-Rhodomonas_salina.1
MGSRVFSPARSLQGLLCDVLQENSARSLTERLPPLHSRRTQRRARRHPPRASTSVTLVLDSVALP